VVVSSSEDDRTRDRGAELLSPRVVWHDLECGLYEADLPLWRELADSSANGSAPGAVLDIGAGSGRVALDLARRGHPVTALDLDDELLNALRARAAEVAVELEALCADARSFALQRRDFGVCLAPMQTIQLLGGSDGRSAFLRRAAAHLRPGGLLACAIVTTLEPFDCAEGDIGPSAETAHVDGVLYSSRASRVVVDPQRIRIERDRRIRSAERSIDELDVVELDRLSAAQLRAEGAAAGLTPERDRVIDATAEHVGSVVVMLRA
jgi:SAM-dependent methyltransferase